MSSSPYSAPYRLSHDSRLTEDYVLSSDIQVKASSPSPIAPVAAPSVDEEPGVLAIDEKEGLVLLQPKHDAATGWSCNTVPGGGEATAVRARTGPDGTLHVFYDDGKLHHLARASGSSSWTTKGTYAGCTSIGITRTPTTSEPLAFGVGKIAGPAEQQADQGEDQQRDAEHGNGLLLGAVVDPLAQGLAGLEMGNMLARQGDRVAGLGIAAHARRTVV